MVLYAKPRCLCCLEHQLRAVARRARQRREAQALLAKAGKRLPKGKMIHTECKPAEIFWPAEEYHQTYLQKGGRFGSAQSAAKGAEKGLTQ